MDNDTYCNEHQQNRMELLNNRNGNNNDQIEGKNNDDGNYV